MVLFLVQITILLQTPHTASAVVMTKPVDEYAPGIGSIKGETLPSMPDDVALGNVTGEPAQPGSVLTLIVIPRLDINVLVNNQTYTIDRTTGQVTIMSEFSNTTFQINLPLTVDIQTGVRAQFQSWNDGSTSNTKTILVPANATLAAAYKQQYLISVSSQHARPQGSGWYDEDFEATVSLPPIVDTSNGTRYVFNTWLGGLTGPTNPARFRVIRPLNITAAWLTLESMRLTFYDSDNTSVPQSKIDSLTLKAPNGTTVTLTNLKSNSSYWFLKGRYRVLTANILNVDSVTGTQQFTSSPNGLARISLELCNMTFKITDYFFGSPLNGGSITITLPNGRPEKMQVQSGSTRFKQLPHASYPFTISRDWTLEVTGETVLTDKQSISIRMIVLPSLVIVLGIPITAILLSLFILKFFHARTKHREETKEITNDEFLLRWYQAVEKRNESN